MTDAVKPLLCWYRRSGVVYFGEHAKIMRLAFNIPDNCETIVRTK